MEHIGIDEYPIPPLQQNILSVHGHIQGSFQYYIKLDGAMPVPAGKSIVPNMKCIKKNLDPFGK